MHRSERRRRERYERQMRLDTTHAAKVRYTTAFLTHVGDRADEALCVREALELVAREYRDYVNPAAVFDANVVALLRRWRSSWATDRARAAAALRVAGTARAFQPPADNIGAAIFVLTADAHVPAREAYALAEKLCHLTGRTLGRSEIHAFQRRALAKGPGAFSEVVSIQRESGLERILHRLTRAA